MALINCPECGREISDRCDICPNCGYPISSKSEAESTVIPTLIECTRNQLAKTIINFKVKSWNISMSLLQVIAFLCSVCSFILFFPEITYNRVNFEISSLEVTQIVGESFLYAAEAVLPFLPYLIVTACIVSMITAIIGNIKCLLWVLTSVIYGGVCAWVTIGVSNVTEISTNRNYCAFYTRTGFAIALLFFVAITVISSITNFILFKMQLKISQSSE